MSNKTSQLQDTRIPQYPNTLAYQIKSFERLPIDLFESSSDGSKYIARIIANTIEANNLLGKHTVLGLATGSSPINVYSELIQLHQEEGLSFEKVISFNLDEYYPMAPDHVESYHHFMHTYLFNHVNIKAENIHIPRGDLKLEEIESFCDEYEKQIEKYGGLDIQLLGIGRTGHIGFNEPGSELYSNTRLIRLDNLTRTDAAHSFGGLEYVPHKAITMGINTILNARKILIMAWGQHKADIVKEAVETLPNSNVPATFLQNHNDVRYFIDKAAAQKLTRVEHPWLVGNCNWDEELMCRAVVWLSQSLEKPILKLTDEDYNEHGLSELLLQVSDAYQLNIQIFNRLQHTITGWPGGKPDTDDSQRPERALPSKKRVLILSPHPDDDVISMGGTFIRLIDQGHEVHVAYQTSGNNAVHNYDALRFLEFYEDYSSQSGLPGLEEADIKKLKNDLSNNSTRVNNDAMKTIKGLIRRGEARAGARYCGLKDDCIHFLDLPFYESGTVKKKKLSQEDISITKALLEDIKPHQIFAAGDLADPHGTHRVCLDAILTSLQELRKTKWIKDCWLWLYRGAWQEYGIEDIEMAVPLSPDELMKKRKAIFMHQSQKDSAPFPGEDEREFWQRSEDRNRNTARLYRNLGFAEYEAMEAFRRWHF